MSTKLSLIKRSLPKDTLYKWTLVGVSLAFELQGIKLSSYQVSLLVMKMYQVHKWVLLLGTYQLTHLLKQWV